MIETKIIEVVESLAVIAASLFAIYGINSWRREMRGRKEFELAEEVLALFYEAQDKIRAIRSPMGWAGEGESRKPGPNETPEQKASLDRAYVVFERYQNSQETFNRLHALRYRFMAVFGREKAKPFDDIRGVINKIFISAHMLGRLWERQTHLGLNEEERKKLIKQIEKHEAVFWEEGEGRDLIAPEVERIVLEIENICEKILR